MKHYYQVELEQAVERLRATMAAADSWALEPCIVKKGSTLYIKSSLKVYGRIIRQER